MLTPWKKKIPSTKGSEGDPKFESNSYINVYINASVKVFLDTVNKTAVISLVSLNLPLKTPHPISSRSFEKRAK